ncbi:MAG: DUF1801 domain-containing protein [Rhodobacter sp.]|nr:DUF1801 domain-containing protein [Rhodobacter sp.]
MTAPAMPSQVRAAFVSIASPAREQLLEIRRMIFEVAQAAGVGPLTETLKWGEPAYLTEASKAGSTVRLGQVKGDARAAVLLNCNTTLVAGFREMFGDAFVYHGNRAILIDPHRPLPETPLAMCLACALTYHRNKKLPA